MLLDVGLNPGQMGRIAAGKEFSVKLFCQIIQMHIVDKSILDWLQPGLPMTASGVAQQGTCRNYGTAKHIENEQKEKGEGRGSGKCGEEDAHS